MYTCLPMHGCPPMRNHTAQVCPAFQMHENGFRACPMGCLPCVKHEFPPVLCVSKRGTTHGGSMHRCPPMHGCPTQETTHWKSVAPSKWISMHRLCVPRVAYFICSINWYISIEFQWGGQPCMGIHAKMSGQAWQSPMRFHKLEVCPAFLRHKGG